MRRFGYLIAFLWGVSAAHGQSPEELRATFHKARLHQQYAEYDSVRLLLEPIEPAFAATFREERPTLLIVFYSILQEAYREAEETEKAERVQATLTELRDENPLSDSVFMLAMQQVAQERSGFKENLPVFEEYKERYLRCFAGENREIMGYYGILAVGHQRAGNTEKYQAYIEKYKKYQQKLPPSLYEQGAWALKHQQFAQAISFFRRDLRRAKKQQGEFNIAYAYPAEALGETYAQLGRYTEAEPLLTRAVNIYGMQQGVSGEDYLRATMLLGNLYGFQGLFEKAIKKYEEVQKAYTKTKDKQPEQYADICLNLAEAHRKLDQDSLAEARYLEAKTRYEESESTETLSYALCCSNLASFYRDQGRYEEASFLYVEANPIFRRVVGEKHPKYASSLHKTGVLYVLTGLFELAEEPLTQAKAIREEVLGKQHPDYANSCLELGVLYHLTGRNPKAEPLYREAVSIMLEQMDVLLPTLSEAERKAYLLEEQQFFDDFYLFAYKNQRKALVAEVFDLQLIRKGILFRSTQKMQRRILSSNDSTLIQRFRRWKAKRAELAELLQRPLAERQARKTNIAWLKSQTNKLERELSRASNAFAQANDRTRYTWQDVQRQLQADEALVDIVRIAVLDTTYAALILTPKKPPVMVRIDKGKHLEGTALRRYRNAIGYQLPDGESYANFWQPIAEALPKGTKKVYFSPDGVFHKINLLTLQNPETEDFLADQLDIQLLGNPKDLLAFAEAKSRTQNYENYQLYLFGYPAYNTGQPAEETETEDKRELNTAFFSQMKADTSQRFWTAGEKISLLPGTKKEVETIARAAKSQQIQTLTFLEDEATEARLKSLESPAVLHVATHGFFLADLPPDSEENLRENPLLRSGLLLAGAELTLQGTPPPDEDGILTAQEAMNLNLDRTEMVVLSACETGLGEVQNGEGVYGLQRAFRQAGARSVLMSLWKVSDEATQQMMTAFYDNLLTRGQPKREAFRNARQSLRQTFPEPYYWGAFVLVGE